MRFAGFAWGAVCRARARRIGSGFGRAGRVVAAGRPAEGAVPAAAAAAAAAATRHALASATPSATGLATPETPSGCRPRAPLPSRPLPSSLLPAAPRPAPLPPIPRPASAGGGCRGGAGGAGRAAGSGGAGSGRSCFGRSCFGRAGRPPGLRRAAAALLLGVFLLPGGLLPGGLLLAGPAEARTAISNRGQAAVTDGPALAILGQRIAQEFTTGPQKGGYAPESVGFDIQEPQGPASRVKVTIHAYDGGRPGAELLAFTKPASIATGTGTLFTAPAGKRLNADTTYYVVVTVTNQGSENNFLRLRRTASDDEDSNGLPGWEISSFSLHTTSSGTWVSDAGYALKMHINAAVRIPDPPAAGADAAVGNLAQDIIDTSVGAGTRARYQGFTTGANPDGYELKSIQVEIDRDFTGATADVTAELWRTSNSGDPGAALIPLNKPGTITAGTNTFTAPAGLFLDRNTTYYLAIGSSGDTLHLSRTEPTGDDAGGLPGWSIPGTHRQDQTAGEGGGFWSYEQLPEAAHQRHGGARAPGRRRGEHRAGDA